MAAEVDGLRSARRAIVCAANWRPCRSLASGRAAVRLAQCEATGQAAEECHSIGPIRLPGLWPLAKEGPSRLRPGGQMNNVSTSVSPRAVLE